MGGGRNGRGRNGRGCNGRGSVSNFGPTRKKSIKWTKKGPFFSKQGPKRDQLFSKQGPKMDQFLLKKGPFRPQTITTKSRLHYSKGVGEAGGMKALLFPAQSKKNINGKINEKTYL